jgi:hypothetical protein
LIQGGGFGLVAMDLGDTPPETARRISLTSWFRLRRAVENTLTVLLALARQSNAKTCASLTLECRPDARVRVVSFSGRGPGRLLRGIRVQVTRRKPGQAVTAAFDACAPQPLAYARMLFSASLRLRVKEGSCLVPAPPGRERAV